MNAMTTETCGVRDFILGITRTIWEGRQIETLRRHYAPGIVVRSPGGIVIGNEAVIAATLATQSEFPDRQLLGEDVIWSESPTGGFLSSHRLLSTATHAGTGVYGPASGRKLYYRVIADCHVEGEQVNDEWLVRDQGAIVRQLGLDVVDYTRNLILAEGGPESCSLPFHPDMDQAGPYGGDGNDNPWGAAYAATLNRIMDADLSAVEADYDRACCLEYAPGISGNSHEFAARFWSELRACFPSARFSLDHRIGREDPGMPPRAALRWNLFGRHDGWGRFGAPTGAEVHVMGISQVEFGPGGVHREWALYDEVAIWKQILIHTGAAPTSESGVGE